MLLGLPKRANYIFTIITIFSVFELSFTIGRAGIYFYYILPCVYIIHFYYIKFPSAFVGVLDIFLKRSDFRLHFY